MAIDNELYDRLGGTWWDDDSNLALLRTGMNPARLAYVRRILTDRLGIDVHGKRVLDVGCGGGLMAEEIARLGCRVSGIDMSEPSLETAQAHAAEQGLKIDYRRARAENLPFDEDTFDIVYCCDVLEHVESVEHAVAEAARVLRRRGVYLFDTVNRTGRSKLFTIKLLQEWNSTKAMEPDLHDWNMFIKPKELERKMSPYGLELQETVGLAPANPLALVRDLRRRRKGEITYAELGRRMQMQESRDKSNVYAGYAIKYAPPPVEPAL
jgi:2-polyprenyl-6-hydroxyphenyl methylase / 3-demethylubiquinone-9 3-methyltransferase